jgi:hypothetical protein
VSNFHTDVVTIMANKRIGLSIRLLVVIWTAISTLAASEFHGTVKANGLAIPGATVTAAQGEKKVVTTTDDSGTFRFRDLAEGDWTIEVEMLGFAPFTQQIRVSPGVPPLECELKFLAAQELLAKLVPETRRPSAVAEAQPPASHPGRSGAAPRVAAASRQQPTTQTSTGPQRLELSASANGVELDQLEGAIRNEEIADLSQSAANSFIVQGSVSSALGMGAQNDWGFGGMGMGVGPMGGPEMMGMGRPGIAGSGGPEGPGQPGMAPPGVNPGFGGGPRGGGGGLGGPRGGFGGPRGGGERRGGWQGRPNALAFGNARRNPRRMYNGNLFASLDNSVWDARSFSVTGAKVEKPSYANARGGIIFGGPLRIPKLVSADKQIFFMVNYQIMRNRTGTVSQPVNMPTALERSGDFSQTFMNGAPIVIYDPTTGAPFPGNKIPPMQIHATAAALLNYFPYPNLPFAVRNYQTAWTSVNNSQNINSRVGNIRIGKKDRLNAGIGYQGSNSSTPNLFHFIDTGSGRGINASFGWSRNITARLINNVQYSFSRNRQLLSPYFANRENVAAKLGIEGSSQNPMNWGPPNLMFTNYGNLTDGNASLTRNQTSAVNESLLWMRGKHNITFGAGYRRLQFNQFADNNGRGTLSFNGFATSRFLNGVPQNGTGYDLADFLLGIPMTSSIRYGNPDKYFRGSGCDVFVNDDWRISGKFTLNFGLRWDYASPMTELYGRIVNLDIAPGFAAVSPVLPTQVGPYAGRLPKSLIHPDYNNFSPRLGIAWRPFSKDSTVVRAGYGVYYNTSIYNLIAANMAQQPPFAQVLSTSSALGNFLDIRDSFLLASAQSSMSTYAIDPDYRVGYVQTWMITIQHDLPFHMFGSVGYLGTKGTRLDQQFIPNSVPPGAVESVFPHGFIYETSNGNSIYHAAQFQLNRRFRAGFMARASYQFAKSIDNAGTGGRGQGGTPVAQNWLDLSAERGLSSFDVRHDLSVVLQYSTGMGVSGGTLLRGWKGALWKDWTISSSISLRSGNPFTAIVGGSRSQVGGIAVANTLRADATGLPVRAPGMLFNTAAFAIPLPGHWGNAGRNTIPGPTTFFLNGAFGRVFRFGERRSVDLQLQAQNLLNHVTITSWGTVLGANNYGLATDAAGMRKLTMNLRVRF